MTGPVPSYVLPIYLLAEKEQNCSRRSERRRSDRRRGRGVEDEARGVRVQMVIHAGSRKFAFDSVRSVSRCSFGLKVRGFCGFGYGFLFEDGMRSCVGCGLFWNVGGEVFL